MPRSIVLAGVLLAAVLPVVRAEAANPAVSVELKQVTAGEAADALTKATGLQVQLFTDPPFKPAPPDFSTARLDERKDFHWTNTALGTALRELCAAYALSCGKSPEGFALRPLFGAGAAAGPATPVGAVQQNGARFAVQEIRVTSGQEVRFDGAPDTPSSGIATIMLQCVLPGDDGDRIASITNLSARDDRGRFLTSSGPPRRMRFQQFPDEWVGQLTLDGPHPQATRLEWLEGDVIAYRKVRSVRLDLPLPQPNAPSRKTEGDLVAEVMRVDLPAGGSVQPDAPQGRGATASVTARVVAPSGVEVRSESNDVIVPLLVGRSGKLYSPTRQSFGHEIDASVQITVEASGYPVISEPIVGVRFDLVTQAEPTRLLTFRLRNVPLPAFGTANRRGGGSSRPQSALTPEHPLYDAGGGTIVTRVEFPPGLHPEGTLFLGLMPTGRPDDEGTIWVEVAVDPSGLGRLAHVKPGRYRLLRWFREKGRQPVLTDGWWFGGEIQVQLQAGRDTSGVSLRWIQSDRTVPAVKAPDVKKSTPPAPRSRRPR